MPPHSLWLIQHHATTQLDSFWLVQIDGWKTWWRSAQLSHPLFELVFSSEFTLMRCLINWNGQFFSKKKHFHLIALHHNFQNFCPLWNGHLYNHKKTIQILKMIHKDKKLSVTTFCKKRFPGRKTAKRLSGKTICKNCKERSTMRNKKKNYQEHNCGLCVV